MPWPKFRGLHSLTQTLEGLNEFSKLVIKQTCLHPALQTMEMLLTAKKINQPTSVNFEVYYYRNQRDLHVL